MTAVLRPVVEGILPASLRRLARRCGTVALTLALFAWLLFPSSAHAGAETPTARAVTAVALAVAGLLLRVLTRPDEGDDLVAAPDSATMGRVGAAVGVLAAGSFVAPAPWLLLLAGGTCLYCATALVPRPAWLTGPEELDPPSSESQELAESLAMALVIALVAREFVLEAFKIPTGSMEPTILGDGRDRRGDRLLATKFVPVRRWDIVVFRFPLFRNTNYIKRLIGLPGEHVEIRDGDIYVDGAVCPKPDDVQTVMWRQAFAPRADEDWVRHFEPDPNGAWVFRTGFAETDAQGDGVAWCQIGRGFEEDQRVAFDVEVVSAGAAGEVLVGLDGGGRHCELRVGAQGARVTGPGIDEEVAGGARLPSAGGSVRLGFSVADRVMRVYADGRQVAAVPHADESNGGLDAGKVRIGVRGLKAVFRRVVAENDVQYGTSGTTTWDVPDDGYVMLGDNTHSSRDSRYWTANVVRTKDGREFVSPDYARVTEDREERVFNLHPDGGVDLIDSYGVRRRLAKDEIAEIRRSEPQPFARRDDLVGRAFVIFFPFPPAGDFRPRFLR